MKFYFVWTPDGIEPKDQYLWEIIFREGWRNGSRANHNVRQFYSQLNRIRNDSPLKMEI